MIVEGLEDLTLGYLLLLAGMMSTGIILCVSVREDRGKQRLKLIRKQRKEEPDSV